MPPSVPPTRRSTGSLLWATLLVPLALILPLSACNTQRAAMVDPTTTGAIADPIGENDLDAMVAYRGELYSAAPDDRSIAP